MACHYRVAVPDAKVGQPEVNLGLIPGAGGTQRLPRLVGIEKAAEMCALGAPVTATEAHALGIIDEIIEGDLLAGALAFAATVANQPPRRTCDRNERLRSTDLSALRAQVHRHAQLAAIDAVQAAGKLPFEEGLRYERKLFLECLHSEEAKQMIAEFFASRASKKPTSH